MKTAFFSFVFAVACICAIFVLHNRIDGTQTDNSVQLVQTANLPGPLPRVHEVAVLYATDNAPKLAYWYATDKRPMEVAEADDGDGFETCGACWFRA